jgi:hypothetical protein
MLLFAGTKSMSLSSACPREVSGRTAIALTGTLTVRLPDWSGEVTCGVLTSAAASSFPLFSR